MEIEHQLQGLRRQVKDLERELHLQEQLVKTTQEDLHRKQKRTLHLSEQVQEAKNRLQDKQAQIDLVREQAVEQRRWMEQRVAERRFTAEYESRHSYYQGTLNLPKQQTLANLLQKSAGMPLLVSPETLAKRQGRVQQLLQLGAEAGYFCIECVPQKPGEEIWVREIADAHYLTNAEGYLLVYLQHRSALILTTWPLQCAWYDLLPAKTLWYDVSFSQVEYNQADVEMQLYHWKLMSTADIVSHADTDREAGCLMEQLKQMVRKVRGGAEYEKRILG